MMSTDSKKSSDDATMMCCASCGIAAVDDIKLKDCDGGCDLVKYCSDNCQENHREQHEDECMKLAVELRDRDLFEQPDESHLGECPICCLPMPLDAQKSTFMGCCSKLLCNGCRFTNEKHEHEVGLKRRCPYCREPVPDTDEEHDKRVMKRIKKNDPAAMREMGKKHSGEGDYESAIEYWTKAAELGDASAHHLLSIMYYKGQGVEKDKKKEIYHLEQAAIGGHPNARFDLGCEEAHNGRFDRARKHFKIAANLGDDDSLKMLRELYADGHASKEDYAASLRAYQAAAEEAKSAERKVAEACYKARRVFSR